MRRAERRLRSSGRSGREQAGDRVDARHLERLARLERRQDARAAAARASSSPYPGGPASSRLWPPGRGDLERAPRPLVPAHVGEIGQRALRHVPVRRATQLRLAAQIRDGLREVAHRIGSTPASAASAADSAGRSAGRARPRRALGDGEHAADAAQATVQAELAHRGVLR